MDKKQIKSDQAPSPIGPYSQAMKAGNLLYISGQIPMNPSNGEIISGSIENETHRVMQNLSAILNETGLNFQHVVKTSIFVKDLNNFVRINEVYGEYFSEDPPARETIEVSRLPKDVNVEISCIAIY